MKKKWKRPKLVVLARGKPEEAVLNYCKLTDNYSFFGPVWVNGCGEWLGDPLPVVVPCWAETNS